MTNLSCAARAGQKATGEPFWSTTKTSEPLTRPDSVQAMLVVPVFPFTTSVKAQSRLRRVPLRPATASESTNASRMRGFSIPARITPASATAVSRSSDESPEPSTMRTPATEIRAAFISSSTTRAPPALVPMPPSSVPSCFRTISAVKLSLSRFIVRAIVESLTEWSTARSSAPDGVVPSPGRPTTVTPCFARCLVQAPRGEERR